MLGEIRKCCYIFLEMTPQSIRSIYTTLKDRFEATLGNVLFSLAVPLVEK